MRYRRHLEGTIALPTTIEDHSSGVSIYGSELRRISPVELLCIDDDEFSPIETLTPTVITFICRTADEKIPSARHIMF